MDNLKITLTKEQYYILREFYRNSPLEQIGTMYGNIIEDKIIINTIKFLSKNELESQSQNEVTIKGKTTVKEMICAKRKGSDVFISMHTHPSYNGIAYLSKSDKKILQEDTKLLRFPAMNMLAIEAVITSKGMNFFIWNEKLNDATRLECYINGKREEDAEKKTIFQIFKDSFNEGRYKSKKLGLSRGTYGKI